MVGGQVQTAHVLTESRLRHHMEDCKYGEQRNNDLRDQEENLTLERMVKIYEAHQAYKKQMSLFREETGEGHVHRERGNEEARNREQRVIANVKMHVLRS